MSIYIAYLIAIFMYFSKPVNNMRFIKLSDNQEISLYLKFLLFIPQGNLTTVINLYVPWLRIN
jgi:hypothetical protein